MIEIELFFKIVESEIRRKHIKYLKKQKCLPSDQSPAEDKADIQPAEDKAESVSAADELIYSDTPKLKEKVKRVKSFNSGIETALKVLQTEYSNFKNRLKKEAEGKKRI